MLDNEKEKVLHLLYVHPRIACRQRPKARGRPKTLHLLPEAVNTPNAWGQAIHLVRGHAVDHPRCYPRYFVRKSVENKGEREVSVPLEALT